MPREGPGIRYPAGFGCGAFQQTESCSRSVGRELGFPGEQIHAVNSVSAGRPFLTRAAKTIETIRDANVFKPTRRESFDDLCFQQSSRDSARPEIDIVTGVFGKFHVQSNIGDLHPAPGFKNPLDLPQSRILFGDEVQDPIG